MAAFIAQAFEAVGIVVVALVVIVGLGAWLLSGLKPGDMP
jgi:hypothetical protein